jgi:hypothetical protein
MRRTSATREKDIDDAVELYRQGGRTLKECARTYRVARMALSHQLKPTPTARTAGLERLQLLTAAQEAQIVHWILAARDRGQIPTYKLLRSFASILCRACRNVDRRPGRNWVYSFIERNPAVAPALARAAIKRITRVPFNTSAAWEDRYFAAMELFGVRPADVYHTHETTLPTHAGLAMVVDAINGHDRACTPLMLLAEEQFRHPLPANVRLLPDDEDNDDDDDDDNDNGGGGDDVAAARMDWWLAYTRKTVVPGSIYVRWLLRVFLPETRAATNGAWRMLVCEGGGPGDVASLVEAAMENRVVVLFKPPALGGQMGRRSPVHPGGQMGPAAVDCFYRGCLSDADSDRDSSAVKPEDWAGAELGF